MKCWRDSLIKEKEGKECGVKVKRNVGETGEGLKTLHSKDCCHEKGNNDVDDVRGSRVGKSEEMSIQDRSVEHQYRQECVRVAIEECHGDDDRNGMPYHDLVERACASLVEQTILLKINDADDEHDDGQDEGWQG